MKEGMTMGNADKGRQNSSETCIYDFALLNKLGSIYGSKAIGSYIL